MMQVSNLLLVTLLSFQITRCINSPKEPGIGAEQKKSGFIYGDFIIGALFPVHEHPLLKGGWDPLICGNIQERYGIQGVEAAFFAIDSINNDENILPKIKLGINIKDACASEPIALHQTIKLIEESVVPVNEDEEILITTRAEVEDDKRVSPLIGVIGPSTTSTTAIVQNLLQLFHIPQIGYSATGFKLTDNRVYDYLLRMVPNDAYQVYLMFKLLRKFDWTYISVLYTDGEYGQGGAYLIQQYADAFNVCIAKTVMLSNNNNIYEYRYALTQLKKYEKAKVVVCFCEEETIKNLLRAIKMKNLTGRFLLIGSDTWAARYNLVKDYEEQAVGSLTLQIKPTVVEEFDDYYFKKNLTNNKRNPWFREFWQYKFNCTLNSISNTHSTPCTGDEDLSKDHKQDSTIPYIIKSIYTMAHNLDKMHNEVCKNETLCDKFYPFNSSNFMEYLKRTQFTYKDEPVNFTSYAGPWRISYNIYNFQKLENGTFHYAKLGEYDGNYDELGDSAYDEEFFTLLKLGKTKLQYPEGETEPPKSVCSEPCPAGQRESNSSEGKRCCWDCIKCNPGEIKLNSTHCDKCPSRQGPNENRTSCEEAQFTYIHWLDTQSVISLIISFIGTTLTIITATIFIKHRETPVVKSSTRELCYMMLIGMIAAHCISYAVVAKPSSIVCAIVRTIPAISFTTIYAALLVKTNRIARILAISKQKFPNLNPRFMSLKAQITITSILIAIETVVCLAMLIKEPELTKEEEYTEGYQVFIHLTCSISKQAIWIPFSFVAFLIIMCTWYAIKTRNLPDNFNEAKFIGFAMYVTCITWIAFGLIYYGSDLQVITTCICASTNALVILIFLFFPKLYIILWVPEKNTRANFTTSKGIRCIIGREDSSRGTNKGNSMETDFKYIPDLKNSQKRKSKSEQSKMNFQRRQSSTVSSQSCN